MPDKNIMLGAGHEVRSSYYSSAFMKSNNVDFLGQIDELKSVGITEQSASAICKKDEGSYAMQPPEKIDISKIRWNPDFLNAKKQ